MSTDSTSPRQPRREPRPPRWKFLRARVVHLDLPRPLVVPKGRESHEVTHAVQVRLQGELDPGDMAFYDSYLPQIRVSGTLSSRMSHEGGEYRFTFYPDVDGDLRPGPIEFRARRDEPFEAIGLNAGDEGQHAAS